MLALLGLPQSCSGDSVSLCSRKAEPLVVTHASWAPGKSACWGRWLHPLWMGRFGQHRAMLVYYLLLTLHCCHCHFVVGAPYTMPRHSLSSSQKALHGSVHLAAQFCVVGERPTSDLTSFFWRNGRVTLFWRRNESLRGGARRKGVGSVLPVIPNCPANLGGSTLMLSENVSVRFGDPSWGRKRKGCVCTGRENKEKSLLLSQETLEFRRQDLYPGCTTSLSHWEFGQDGWPEQLCVHFQMEQ